MNFDKEKFKNFHQDEIKQKKNWKWTNLRENFFFSD